MANRKNSHRRRVRVAVLMVLCGAVFAAFFARLAWMQFVRADYYADKAAEASSASYTVTQHAARGAIVDSAGVVLAHLLRRVVPRTRQHAVVPPLVLIVAEHVGGNVHLDLVAAQIAVENRLQGFGVLVVLAPSASFISPRVFTLTPVTA